MHSEVQQWLDEGNFITHNGNKIFYNVFGTGSPLLILHGYPYSSFEWKETINELSQAHRVIVFDLLGMGFSDKPKNHRYSYEEHCEIVSTLLNALSVAEVHILAHDMGVSVAQELIAKDAAGGNNFKINSIAFMNGGLFMDTYKPRFIQRLLSQSPGFVGKFVSKAISKKMVNKSVKALFGTHTQPSDAYLNKQWEILNFNDGKSISYLIGRLVFDKFAYQSRWIAAMQKTNIPLCYICGPADPNSGEHMAKRYEELIANSKVYRLEKHIGHWPMLEDRQEALNAYNRFRLYLSHLS